MARVDDFAGPLGGGRGGGRGPSLCLGIRFRREGSSLDKFAFPRSRENKGMTDE
jgi:hypothetical protein